MSQREFDLIVIGAGSGGVRAARVAANHGARVAIAEEFRVGGTCVIRGCVPKKLYVLASRFRDAFDDAAGFGWSVEPPRFDWPRLVAAKEKEITRLEGLYAQNLEKAGVELIRQRAVVEDGATVRFANGEHGADENDPDRHGRRAGDGAEDSRHRTGDQLQRDFRPSNFSRSVCW